MINTFLLILSVSLVIFGSIALVVRNDKISTRHRRTQVYFVAMIIGGLLYIDGNTYGLFVETVGLICYAVRLYVYIKEERGYKSRGMNVPEYKKP